MESMKENRKYSGRDWQIRTSEVEHSRGHQTVTCLAEKKGITPDKSFLGGQQQLQQQCPQRGTAGREEIPTEKRKREI